MRIKVPQIIIGLLCFICLTSTTLLVDNDWGVFGHRKINRLAIFTLPPEMIRFYKKHIELITDKSTAPDKRRYSVKEEATRHYIDIDHWGAYPFPEVPRQYRDAIFTYSDVFIINNEEDTIYLKKFEFDQGVINHYHADCKIDTGQFRRWFHEAIDSTYEQREWDIDDMSILDSLECDLNVDKNVIYINDHFTPFGILPFHIENMQHRLTSAFYFRDIKGILSLSAEIGHYISDAHVPLHTTENYNGQMTDQIGLHAFWESRLPELYADDQYDYFVGKPTHIDDVNEWAWKMVLDSHAELKDVLAIEKYLSEEFPDDKKMCYEDRFDRTVKIQCEAYSRAYHEKLDGMVEDRMRDAIQAVASSWYTAWIEAGQPDLSKLLEDYTETDEEKKRRETLEQKFNQGEIMGRKH